jgi:hypothetical protein
MVGLALPPALLLRGCAPQARRTQKFAPSDLLIFL